jgi:hypothetical protein
MRHRLLVAVSLVLVSSLASAGSNPTPTTVSLVNDKLVQPLAAKDNERSKFSRARLPPSERRVRVLDEKPRQDGAGKAFFTFAIDTRHGWNDSKQHDDASWAKASMTGCVYPDSGEVFIKRGNAFHPAAAALGKKTKAAPASTCTVSVAQLLSLRS